MDQITAEFGQVRVIRSLRKSVSVTVRPDGSLLIRAPHILPERIILSFLRDRKEWVEKTREHIASTAGGKVVFTEGAPITLAGMTFRLHLTDGRMVSIVGRMVFFPKRFLPEAPGELKKWYYRQTETMIGKLTAQWAKRIGVSYRRISVRDASTRWGSCSTSGTLSFSWRLAMAPPPVAEYVVIHELCHIRHPDHSRAFWDEVFRYCPAYRSHRTWLKRHGNELTVE